MENVRVYERVYGDINTALEETLEDLDLCQSWWKINEIANEIGLYLYISKKNSFSSSSGLPKSK